jgi:beta-glucosidase
VPALYVTKNGCVHPDRPDAQNEIWDTARVMYLQPHLVAAHRATATAEGYLLRGFFLWSRFDNFEWAFGDTKLFGLHYVNYETPEYAPKLSAKIYGDVIRRNAVGGPLPV